ncbi:hypothetical protein ACERII_04560 [Evansella sp. AB-rgal1]|uniref:cytochrome bd oxidase small subunit CydS n=1 Tax=Evansella sp. AB-rgal1 TaxID=3242696 RepID=UPI00359E0EDE
MNVTWFFITIAPPLVLIACVALVFLWATYGKTPAFILENSEEQERNNTKKTVNE